MLSQLRKFKNNKSLIVMILVAMLGWAGFQVSEHNVAEVVDILVVDEQPQEIKATRDLTKSSMIVPERRVHILYGDATGGGHKFGTGSPCKSEFPERWDEDTIIKEIELIAANDNLNWKQQRNGYYVTEQKVGTVKLRVVKGRKNKQVITAYPTNTRRNPCPANDN